MAEHTPGQWWLELRGNSINGARIMAGEAVDGCIHIASLTHKADKSIYQKEADARLIVAAPAMRYALKEAEDILAHAQWVKIGGKADEAGSLPALVRTIRAALRIAEHGK